MSSSKFWRLWVLANAVGEMVGLGAVFAVGVLVLARLGEPTTPLALAGIGVVIIILAVFEGAVVGLAQGWVLRGPLPMLARRSWTGATVVGAVVAWLLGMIPSTLASFGEASGAPVEEPPVPVMLALAAAMGLALGLVLSGAQVWVLRRHVARAWLWLPANALAWGVAMPLIFWLVGATVAEAQTLASLALLVLGLGIAGAIVGGVHGLFLVRLLRMRRPTRSGHGS